MSGYITSNRCAKLRRSSRTVVLRALGGTREIRAFCRERGIVYQGFSLLTANVEVLQHPLVRTIAGHLQATVPQVIFAFARQVGMLPLTGTTNAEHMREDLASLSVKLPEDAVETIESLVG